MVRLSFRGRHSSSNTRIDGLHQQRFSQGQYRVDLIATDGGKVIEKLGDTLARTHIIKQILDRDTSSGKDGSATQNIRRLNNNTSCREGHNTPRSLTWIKISACKTVYHRDKRVLVLRETRLESSGLTDWRSADGWMEHIDRSAMPFSASGCQNRPDPAGRLHARVSRHHE